MHHLRVTLVPLERHHMSGAPLIQLFLLLSTYYSLLTTYHLLLTTYYLLLATHYLLLRMGRSHELGTVTRTLKPGHQY